MERSDEACCEPEITGRRNNHDRELHQYHDRKPPEKKEVLRDVLKLSEEKSLLLDDPNLEPDTFEKA